MLVYKKFYILIKNLGLIHIYDNQFCHRDLKTENILVGSVISKLLIADFGFSTFNDKYGDNKLVFNLSKIKKNEL